jgi:hypothetical protein
MNRGISPGGAATFSFRLTNLVDASGAYRIRGSAAPGCFSFRYWIDGVDRTADVLAGTGGSRLARGDSVEVRLDVAALGCARSGDAAEATLDVSPSRGVRFDRVRARVSVD